MPMLGRRACPWSRGLFRRLALPASQASEIVFDIAFVLAHGFDFGVSVGDEFGRPVQRVVVHIAVFVCRRDNANDLRAVAGGGFTGFDRWQDGGLFADFPLVRL